jgi:hypothetical protein
MRPEDQGPYMTASVLAFGGTLLGYYAPLIGVTLGICLIVALAFAPQVLDARRLTIRDTRWWVRRSPLMGLGAGLLFRWIIGGLTATGGT